MRFSAPPICTRATGKAPINRLCAGTGYPGRPSPNPGHRAFGRAIVGFTVGPPALLVASATLASRWSTSDCRLTKADAAQKIRDENQDAARQDH